MTSFEDLHREIEEIKARNRRVEADKAWEISRTRKLVILILTYFLVVIFFFVAKFPNPFMNALVPSGAFVLSTLTVPWFKTWWIKRLYRK